MAEEVLVVRNDVLSPFLGGFGGNGVLITDSGADFTKLILENHHFLPRGEAEQDFTRKQVIPYVCVRHGNEFLLLKRTERQTEKRLHNMLSLGIGGHINPSKSSESENVIMEGLHRELEEEVHVANPKNLEFIGIINDERNSVSRVHLGLFFVLETSTPEFTVNETDLMSASWVRADKLKSYYDNMETWSQIVYDYYISSNFVQAG